jgi:hypothetical protein
MTEKDREVWRWNEGGFQAEKRQRVIRELRYGSDSRDDVFDALEATTRTT